MTACCSTSVSYTHLDVYKRQVTVSKINFFNVLVAFVEMRTGTDTGYLTELVLVNAQV